METVRNVASHAPGSHTCWQRNWPRVFLLMSLAVTVLAFVGIILGFVKIIFAPNIVLLNIYCLIFSLLGFSAELRQFAFLRRFIYLWMKYFYFLVYYRARGIFYILFGFLLLGTGVVELIGGILAIVLGVVMLLVGLVVGLPQFEDPAEEKRVQEEFQRYYGGGPPTTATAPPPPPPPPPPATAATAAAAKSGVQADTPAVPASKVPADSNKDTGANLYREYNFGGGGGGGAPAREASSTYSTAGAPANPYEDEGTFRSGGANMFGTANAAVKPPMQEAGLTRGDSESALRKQFAEAVAKSADNNDLR
ncbi:COPI associated protein [Novymonas esmeraldas]|uniref:COPI associated protein n=1 Tax=Novymonas esmeraldas TaxID=1808958 RepID=A0AAW0F8Z5_9TRYP